MDGREPQIHKVWNFGEDIVTCEAHPTARVDVGAGFVGGFATNYLTPSWVRIPMFEVNSINGSVQWLGVPDPLRTDGLPWTDNILSPSPALGTGSTDNNTNWEANMVDPMEVLLYRGVYLPVPFWITSVGVRKTRAALPAAYVTIYFKRIVRRACKFSPLPTASSKNVW